MSAGRETTFKDRVLKELNAIPHCKAVKIDQRSKVGEADVVGCFRGHFFAFELKRSMYEEPEPIQIHVLRAWRHAQGIALVAFPENWAAVLEELKRRCLGKIPSSGGGAPLGDGS